MEPYEVDHFNTTIHHTVQYQMLQERIVALGNYTTKSLELGNDDVKTIAHLYRVWLEYFVTHHTSLMEIQDLPVPIGRIFTGLQIFTELTRLFYLEQIPLIRMLPDYVPVTLEEDTRNPLWVVVYKSFDISDQYEAKEEKDTNVEDRLVHVKRVWSTDIAYMTQSEIVLLIFFLGQMLGSPRLDCIGEFRTISSAVWLRAAVLMQEYHDEKTLDEPTMRVAHDGAFLANRAFMGLVSIYMGEIARRFYEQDLKREIVIDAVRVERVRAWLTHVVKTMSSDVFTDLWVKTAEETYAYAGDKTWYKFYYPTGVYTLGECLLQLRPHLYRRYFSERNMNQAVLTNVDLYPAFMLRVVDSFIGVQTKGIVKWHDAVVIHSHEIALSAYNMSTDKCPLIVQPVSIYQAYDRGRMIRNGDGTISTALAHWFYLLRSRYNGQLHGNSLTTLVDQVLGSGIGSGTSDFIL